MKKLFTERHGMMEPRVKEHLDAEVKKGLLSIINNLIEQNLFGSAYSAECPDGGGNSIGCDTEKLKGGLAAYKVIWPGDWPTYKDELPNEAQLFDLIEFLYEHAGLPKAYAYHSFF